MRMLMEDEDSSGRRGVEANPHVWKSMEDNGFNGICQWRMEVGCSEEWQRLGFNVSPGMVDDSIGNSMSQIETDLSGRECILRSR